MKKVYVPFYKELLNCFLKKVCICHSCTAVPHPYQHLGIARFGGWFVCFGFGHSSHRIFEMGYLETVGDILNRNYLKYDKISYWSNDTVTMGSVLFTKYIKYLMI